MDMMAVEIQILIISLSALNLFGTSGKHYLNIVTMPSV